MSRRGRLKGSVAKHDWTAIRLDFVRSNYGTIGEWLTARGYPSYWANSPRLSGIVTERAEYKEKVLMKASEQSLEEDVENEVKLRRRQAKIARFLQLKGADALNKETLKVENVEDARKLVVSGLEQERKALGIDGGAGKSLTQININTGPKTNLDKFIEGASYEELIGLIAELKRTGASSPAKEVISSVSGETEEREVV